MNTKRVKKWAAAGMVLGLLGFMMGPGPFRTLGYVVGFAAFIAFAVARLDE